MICKYENKNDIIYQTFPETISNSDFRLINEEINLIEEKYSVVPNFIVDIRNVKTLKGDYHSIQKLAAQRRDKKFSNNILEAILVANDFQMGFARMYQTFNDNPQLTIQIFKDEAKAIEWIKSNETGLTGPSSINPPSG